MRLPLNVISGSILLNWDLTEKIFGKTEKCMSWENTVELFEKGTVKEEPYETIYKGL